MVGKTLKREFPRKTNGKKKRGSECIVDSNTKTCSREKTVMTK